jgi:CRISPR-associated endonuclease Csy4
MNHYIDIKLFPDAEIPATVLMNATYTKLHKALFGLHATNIGVSFPKLKKTLGDVLRIHGTAEALDKLQCLNWIGGMKGYCDQGEIKSVPTGAKYRVVSRRQSTMSNAKLNRLLKRGSITEDQVKQYTEKMFATGLKIPYLELVSGSSGHKHRRYIECGPLLDSPVEGAFDQFGLSKTATVPWF